MISKKSKVTLILVVLFALWVCHGLAEGQSTKAIMAIGSPSRFISSETLSQVENNQSQNESVTNNSSVNISTINNTLAELPVADNASEKLSNTSMNGSSSGNSITSLSSLNSRFDNPTRRVPVMDLSRYSKDRLNKSLGGYRNVIYPMAESSGFTATTSSGSGGGGCGC